MVNGVLIDLSGVLYEGDTALPGAAEALARLSEAGLPARYLTNTTRKPRRRLLEQLQGFGLPAAPEHLFTPAVAAKTWLRAHGYSPHLLVHPDLEEDFADCRKDLPVAVVVGDAGPFFTFDRLNAAFRLLVDGAPFLALAHNRVFKDADGKLSMDAGAYVAALEYASGMKSLVLGKPAPAFLAGAAASMGCVLEDVAMIGDDVEADVAGALRAGAGVGILVRTGKYRPGDETSTDTPPSMVVPGIAEAVAAIVGPGG